MATCLFTDELLDSDTRIEHTIPSSLGGRLKSREVSSNTFNERCGSYVDDFLRRVYSVLLNRLGPILPSENRPANLPVSIPGEEGNFVLEPGAVLTRSGIHVLDKFSDTGKPKAFVGPDIDKLEKKAKQICGDSYKISFVPASDAVVSSARVPAIGAEIELAALKCSLLTFDHLLRERTNPFTRSECLQTTRHFIREAITRRVIDGNSFIRISLGLQYEKLPDYAVLRHYMHSDEVTPFEHVMFAAGNIANRCIDIVWLVFGFDLFGFRISNDYHGPAFCYGFVNPIHKGYSCSPLRELATSDSLLCRPTDRRAFSEKAQIEGWAERVLDDIAPKRLHALCKAVMLIETTCDDFLISMLKEEDSLSENRPCLMRVLLLDRLRKLYGRRSNSQELIIETARYFENSLQSLSAGLRNQTTEDAHNTDSWLRWLEVYRESLKASVAQFGLPGDGFVSDSRVISFHADERQVGKPPDDPGAKTRVQSK